jgi:hypothetical protein
MNNLEEKDTALALVEMLKRKAPEYLDLFTAQTDADFEKAFDVLLERSVAGLEVNKNNFVELDEEALSAILALALSTPGLSVTQETQSNGHVDITITADHCVPLRKKLGEAKIWDGPEYHIKGIKQLLDRYTTGREGRGLVITYVKKRNIKGLFTNLRKTMNEKRPCKQTADTIDHILKWSFISTHAHSCGETLEVGHIGCNLYAEPAEEPAEEAGS